VVIRWASVALTAGLPSGAAFPIGTTTNTYTVTPTNKTCSFTVAVNAPEAALQGNSLPIADGDATPNASDDTDFGVVSVGSSLTHTFTLTNAGTADWAVSSIAKTGANAGEFIVSGITLPTAIATGNSVTFAITFTPTSATNKYAAISIANNDCNEGPYDFALNGGPPCSNAAPAGQPIIGASAVGGNMTLSVFSGNLNGAPYWEWYQNTCGAISLGAGPSIIVPPTANATSYYARGVAGGCTATAGPCGTIQLSGGPRPRPRVAKP